MRSPSEEETEDGARACESWGNVFPVEFPEKNLTRKMVNMCLVTPTLIRKNPLGMMNKILRLEQEGEHIHQVMNVKERRKKMILKRHERFWKMLVDWEDSIYSDYSDFEPIKWVK